MAICKFPLYSHRAWGKFYGVFEADAPHPSNLFNPLMCIYQRRMGTNGKITIKEKYYKPSNPQSPAQTARRNLFASGLVAWRGLSDAEKENYKIYGAPFRLPGWHRFMSLYLKGLV